MKFANVKEELVLSATLSRGGSFTEALSDLIERIDNVDHRYEITDVDFDEDRGAYGPDCLGSLVVTFLRRRTAQDVELNITIQAEDWNTKSNLQAAEAEAKATAAKIDELRRGVSGGAPVYPIGGTVPAGVIGEIINRLEKLEGTIVSFRERPEAYVPRDAHWSQPSNENIDYRRRMQQAEAVDMGDAGCDGPPDTEPGRFPVQLIDEYTAAIRENILNQIATGVPEFSDGTSALGAIEGAVKAERVRHPSPGKDDHDRYREAMRKIAATCVRELIRTTGWERAR